MTVDALLNIGHEVLTLGWMTLAILSLLGIIGLWPVLSFCSQREALRWPIYAPVTGLALLTIVGLPLSLSGLPVNRWAIIFATINVLLTVATIAYTLRSMQGRRLLWAYLRKRWLNLTIIFLVPVLLSTYLIAGRGLGHVQDIWGSGDYGAYWVVADYLQNNGANIDSYNKQSIFYASDIYVHLTNHARLGCMVSHSFLGVMITPGNIHHLIIPFLVALIILMLGLAQRWLEQERLKKLLFVLPLLCSPFLYFLLFFTYLSQATGVLLFMTSLLIVSGANVVKSGKNKRACMILAGIFAGASLLHYPSLLIAGVIFMTFLFCEEFRRGTLRYSLLLPATALLVSVYYIPQIIHELSLVKGATLPGWDWTSLIGSFEFLGLRPILGYGMPLIRSHWFTVLEYGVSFSLFVLLIYGAWQSSIRIAALTVISTTALLATVALVKYVQHIPNASHAFVKSISTFAPFILLIMIIPLCRLFTRKKFIQRLAVASLTGVLILGQIVSLNYGSHQRPWFTDDLISLARRQLDKGHLIRYGFNFPYNLDPIARDTRLMVQKKSLVKEPFVTLMLRDQLSFDENNRILDSAGDYVAVYSEVK